MTETNAHLYGTSRFLVFQRNEVVDNHQYVAGEVPMQWFAANRVEELVKTGAAREATEGEMKSAAAADAKGERFILAARTPDASVDAAVEV